MTVATAKKLLRMLNGDQIPSSSFPKALAKVLKDEGILGITTHGSRISYYLLDNDACRRLIESKYLGGSAIENWIAFMSDPNGPVERSALVKEVGDSKYLNIRTFQGFLVNCCEPIQVRLADHFFELTPVEGMAFFIQEPACFEIPLDVVVVGIENGENFRAISRQRHLFEAEKVLFVSRYPQSSDLRNWLKEIPNPYVHFGDFDLAGIHIFLTEFYKHLGEKATFFIPEDLEERISRGNHSLYDLQYAKYHNMHVDDLRLLPLIDMIHHHHRVYEQEGYIE